MEFIANLTTREYIAGDNVDALFRGALRPLESRQAIIRDDVGGSRWKATDRIVKVPQHVWPYVVCELMMVYCDKAGGAVIKNIRNMYTTRVKVVRMGAPAVVIGL